MENSLPFHLCHVDKISLFINRAHTILHSIAISFLLYYRASFFFQDAMSTTPKLLILPWIFISSAELVLSFCWLLGQAYRWRQVTRSVFADRLPGDEKLPSIDVFVCTADPEKEPTLAVMNTVLSAMAMDYPAEKLHVYLSDDGGSSLTLNALREAWAFAKWWIPFCKSHKIDDISPEAYFFGGEGVDSHLIGSDEFKTERKKIKEKYEVFKNRVEDYTRVGEKKASNHTKDHPAIVEVMQDSSSDQAGHVKIPLLVYVSREKRPSHFHNFKAGALNVLQRVSGVLSNSPYILMLDCDMNCNDPIVARNAMCFHLDPKISHSLSFVQFPQRFRNLSQNDIYDSQYRSIFKVQWRGVDGQRGPLLCGTGFFIKRLSLHGNDIIKEDRSLTVQWGADPMKLREAFGPSNEFVKTLHIENYMPNMIKGSDATLLIEEMELLASSTYEIGTKWGQEVGFLYGSVAEDYLTAFTLHCKGWTSVYCDPPRPQFLGSGTTNLNDYLIHVRRWSSGSFGVFFSKYCPLIYGPLHMPILQRMCYAQPALWPISSSTLLGFAIVPQLCLFFGIPIYPEDLSTSFAVVSFIFLSALSQHLYEVLTTGGSFQTWIYEQRIWMMTSIAHFYGGLDSLREKIGIREAKFNTTNKVENDERDNLYQKGLFDFRTSTMFLAPMVALIVLNMVSFLVGIARIILINGDLNKMFIQVFISFYILVINYPIIEGMIIRKDNGRIPLLVVTLSIVFCVIFLSLVSIVFLY